MAPTADYGKPRDFGEYRKADAPPLGAAFGQWAGRDLQALRLPGGGVMQFDLSRLTLADYRTMRTHYQINASMSILTFMIHNLDWHIECEVPRIAEQLESNLRDVWTRLIRGISQAYWAGFSPCVLEYENNPQSDYVELCKVKDMLPEESRVEWAQVPGWAPPGRTPPQLKVFNGMNVVGAPWPVPPENTLWYPLLMENGDYYGKKLLKPSFAPWFFSQLLHLFSNRYYERFGEPLPIGRAPFENEVDMGGGTMVSGKTAMEMIITNLRNRSVVVLPSEKEGQTAAGTGGDYSYDIEYLESQMRGADFERYMARLDEEMSLSVFTPTLLFRTADVGSYNLGTSHLQIYQWCLQALAGDLAQYIEEYPLTRLHDFNFGPNAPRAYFRWRSIGKDDNQILNTIVEYTLRGNHALPDLGELGRAIGMTFNEIQTLAPVGPGGEMLPNDQLIQPPPEDPGTGGDIVAGEGYRKPLELPLAAARLMTDRLTTQVERAWRDNKFGPGFKPTPGYRRRFEESLVAEGYERGLATRTAEGVYGRLGLFLNETIGLGQGEYSSPGDFMRLFGKAVENECVAIPAPVKQLKG